MTDAAEIKVLIIDDSATARASLHAGLSAFEDFVVVAEASGGEGIVELVLGKRPDIILTDVYMKGQNGIEVTRAIMAGAPKPVVIITGINPDDPKLAYEALQAGALEVLPKLPAPTHRDYEARCQRMARVLRNLSKVPVVTRFRRGSPGTVAARAETAGPAPAPPLPGPGKGLVLIGASTGGPPLLKDILSALPSPFPLPIVIAQHITQGFGASLASWLSAATGRTVIPVVSSRRLEPGQVYLAPDDQQLRLVRPDVLTPFVDEQATICPSIDVLFESCAKWAPASTVAVLLSGMGRDGVRGMAALRQGGGLTVAQQPDTCTVGSMPAAAIEVGAACHVLPPDKIARLLSSLVEPRRGRTRE